jgi:hypothetical protein
MTASEEIPSLIGRMQVAKRSKGGRFPARRTRVRCRDGSEKVFHSQREAYRFLQLEMMQANRVITDLVCQPAFPIAINGVEIGTYVADFSYIQLDSAGMPVKRVIEDVKSSGTAKDATYLLKKKAVEALYGCTIREIATRAPSMPKKRRKKPTTSQKEE